LAVSTGGNTNASDKKNSPFSGSIAFTLIFKLQHWSKGKNLFNP
jgi:hypothetical protein